MRPFGSPHQLQKRRERAIELLQKGMAPVDVAAQLDVDRRSVRRWKAAWLKGGDQGIESKPAPGRPPKLTPAQRRRIEQWLLKGARASGFDTDLWTCARVVSLIRKKCGIVYHPDHVGRLLHSMGWSCQKPARRAVERNDEEVARWIKEEWPRIKKKPRD